MMNNFSKAAASYFGLGEIMPRKVDMFSDGPANILVIELNLTDEDLAGIVARMQVQQQLEKARQEPQGLVPILPSEEDMRAEYNAMSKQERGRFGSFHAYRTWRGANDPYAAPTAEIELPAYVYLSPAECAPQQKAMAVGQDEKGNYAIAVEDLLPEQRKAFEEALPSAAQARAVPADQLRAAYIERTVAALARLNGADGKPTSNADDFGGLPG